MFAFRGTPAHEAQKQKENLGLPSSTCGSLGKPGHGDGRGRVVAMAVVPVAGACPRATSGLAKAFGSNDYGGVDFSTLGLRYMSDRPGTGVQYSFSGRPAPLGPQVDEDQNITAVTNSTADLRTWLVLNPDDFWVNLNPTEPNRIVAPELGQTNAGRALLEADLQMKRTQGRLLDPDTAFGAKYWKALTGESANACFSARLWIVPGDVQVREDGSSLYILKAPLAVKLKSEHLGGRYECDSNPATDARNEQVERSMVLPKIVEAVNTAPEYAPLRQSFAARIVAQWIRDRHQDGKRTSFDHLIDSGNLGTAKLQDGWRPQLVFDSYVHSIKDGEFTYKRTVHRGRATYLTKFTFGGVDFSKVPMNAVSGTVMNQQHPGLPKTVHASVDHPASAPDGSIWLGETANSPSIGLWTRATDAIGGLVSGRTATLIVVLVALGVVTFGFRSGSRRRRWPTA